MDAGARHRDLDFQALIRIHCDGGRTWPFANHQPNPPRLSFVLDFPAGISNSGARDSRQSRPGGPCGARCNPMAKKKASNGLEGSRIRVRAGVASPEFPEITIAGWTGTVVEVSGKPPAAKVIIEWDASTLSAMPPEYVKQCEAQQLFYQMACLAEGDVEPA
jgi:hypothetical protein